MKEKANIIIKKNLSGILVFAVCIFLAIGILILPGKYRPATINLSEYSSVNAICELATLKSFYHNVAIYEAQPDGANKFVNDVVLWPLGKFSKIGYKQFWLEYSGIVEIGIDASQIQITGPDSDGVVEVFVPDAQVFSVYADEKSLTEPLSENGWFTKISGKEKTEAFSMAQSAMQEEAAQDQSLLRRAKENAKLLLEQYITNTGKEMGVDLSVRWV